MKHLTGNALPLAPSKNNKTRSLISHHNDISILHLDVYPATFQSISSVQVTTIKAYAVMPAVSLQPHHRVLDNIISRLDKPDLVTCLRVSLDCFKIAGKYLYAEITFPPEGSADAETDLGTMFFRGSSAKTPKVLGDGEQTNFKKLLLARVRRLNVTVHIQKSCVNHPGVGKFFTNLDVLTIIPPRLSFFNSVTNICTAKDFVDDLIVGLETTCDFVPDLSAKHIVYRNLGRDGLPVLFPFDKVDPRLESVTYVLPINPHLAPETLDEAPNALTSGSAKIPLFSHISRSFPQCPSIRIVFLEDRPTELDHILDESGFEDGFLILDMDGEAVYNFPPGMSLGGPEFIPEEDFTRFMRSIMFRRETKYEVYGMEWSPVGEEWDPAKRACNHELWTRVERTITEGMKDIEGRVVFKDLIEYLDTCPEWEIDGQDRDSAEVLLDLLYEGSKSSHAKTRS